MKQWHFMLLALAVVGLLGVPAVVSAAVWNMETVQSLFSVGQYSSLDLDSGGYPHISYYNESGGNLEYAWKDAAGWHRTIVDSSGDVGKHTSLALSAQDRPRISYYDITNSALKYAYYLEASGWHTDLVRSFDDVGWYTSLGLDTWGNPQVSYFDATHSHLMYAWKYAGVWTSETADGSPNVGHYSSLAVRKKADQPRISYFDAQNGALKYAWRGIDGDWTRETIDTGFVPTQAGLYTSIVLDEDGYPHISYATQPNGYLKYAFRDTEGWHTELVDDSDIPDGYYTSIALDSYGLPHISYYGGGDLKYAWKKPSGAWEITEIDEDATLGQTSLALDAGNSPKISYYCGGTAKDLRYAWQSGNRAPAPVSDTYTAYKQEVLTVAGPGVLENDIDLDGDSLTAVHQHGPWHGTLDLHADGAFTYLPEEGFVGDDSFVYRAYDGDLSSAATVIITVLPRPIAPLPGSIALPTDPDGDGIYEDLNGNGRLDFSDVVLFFNQMTWIAENEPTEAFDLNGNARIDFADIVTLFNEV